MTTTINRLMDFLLQDALRPGSCIWLVASQLSASPGQAQENMEPAENHIGFWEVFIS